MLKNHFAKISISLLLLVFILSACGVFREQVPTPTPQPADTSSVTADEIAQAMQEDHFYADYRGMTLVIHSTLASLNQQSGEWMLELKTTGSEKVFCDLGHQTTSAQVGDAVTVQSPGSDAQRDGSAVILGNCVLK